MCHLVAIVFPLPQGMDWMRWAAQSCFTTGRERLRGVEPSPYTSLARLRCCRAAPGIVAFRRRRSIVPGRRRLRSPVPSNHPLLLEWWTDLEGEDHGVNTRLAYVRDLKDFAEYVGGNLADAAPDDLIRFTRRMTEAGLAGATRAGRRPARRQFCEWLGRREGRPFSVAQDLRPPRRPHRVHRWWTEDQVAQFRAAFQGDAPRVIRDRAMAELGLMGLRVSEVIRLDIERVVHLADPDRASLVVLRKGNKEQVLPVTADARAALLAWPALPTQAPRKSGAGAQAGVMANDVV